MMSLLKAIILTGISGSGKSTWAKQQVGYKVVCRDDIRSEILKERGVDLQSENMWAHWRFKKSDEQEVTNRYWNIVENHASCGNNIILADTNLNSNRRESMKKRLEELNYVVEHKVIPIDYETAVKRDLNRLHSVGAAIIWKQYKELYGETYVPPKEAPKAVIFDIDGTLAKMTNRGPFDWAKVCNDEVIDTVAELLHNYYDFGYKVILLSGRDSVCRDQTELWLDWSGLPHHELHMRAEGDQRRDAIVKKELFDAQIRDRYNVVAVFDDRPQMVRLWNLMGLKTFACADPYLEF